MCSRFSTLAVVFAVAVIAIAVRTVGAANVLIDADGSPFVGALNGDLYLSGGSNGSIVVEGLGNLVANMSQLNREKTLLQEENAALRVDVTLLSDELSRHQTIIATLKANVSALDAQNANLLFVSLAQQSALSALESTVSTLQSIVDTLHQNSSRISSDVSDLRTMTNDLSAATATLDANVTTLVANDRETASELVALSQRITTTDLSLSSLSYLYTEIASAVNYTVNTTALEAPEPTATPVVACNMSDWSSWSVCGVACGAGSQVRNRTILQAPTNACQSCELSVLCGHLGEVRTCNLHPCSVDCNMTEWGTWGTCSTTCGVGTSVRTRSISVVNQFGGAECPQLVEFSSCGSASCSVSGTGSGIGSCGSTYVSVSQQLANLDGCTEINGTLVFDTTSKPAWSNYNLDFHKVLGSVVFSEYGAIDGGTGLNNLTEIAGNLTLRSPVKSVTESELHMDSLRVVGGSIIAEETAGVKPYSWSNLAKLEWVGGDLALKKKVLFRSPSEYESSYYHYLNAPNVGNDMYPSLRYVGGKFHLEFSKMDLTSPYVIAEKLVSAREISLILATGSKALQLYSNSAPLSDLTNHVTAFSLLTSARTIELFFMKGTDFGIGNLVDGSTKRESGGGGSRTTVFSTGRSAFNT
jgi:hypothetical protein